jgi:hypothetical protein
VQALKDDKNSLEGEDMSSRIASERDMGEEVLMLKKTGGDNNPSSV